MAGDGLAQAEQRAGPGQIGQESRGGSLVGLLRQAVAPQNQVKTHVAVADGRQQGGECVKIALQHGGSR